jgi:hypothetical protein
MKYQLGMIDDMPTTSQTRVSFHFYILRIWSVVTLLEPRNYHGRRGEALIDGRARKR